MRPDMIERELRMAESIEDELYNLREKYFAYSGRFGSGGVMPGLYEVPAYGKVVNFQSQQKSAIALALHLAKVVDRERMDPSKISVSIIGAGLSGVTLASMLVCATEFKVDIYEKSSDVLHRQSEAHHRYIHPSINLWPGNTNSDGLLPSTTNLPVLNWYAAPCPTVCNLIREQFNEIRRKYPGRITPLYERTYESHVPRGDRLGITYEEYGVTNTQSKSNYDFIIFCTGFSKEGSEINGSNSSYWIPVKERMESAANYYAVPPYRVICGSGDGGLIDFITRVLDCDMQKIASLAENLAIEHSADLESTVNPIDFIDKCGFEKIISYLKNSAGDRGAEEGVDYNIEERARKYVLMVTKASSIYAPGASSFIHQLIVCALEKYENNKKSRSISGVMFFIEKKSRVIEKKEDSFYLCKYSDETFTAPDREIRLPIEPNDILERIGGGKAREDVFSEKGGVNAIFDGVSELIRKRLVAEEGDNSYLMEKFLYSDNLLQEFINSRRDFKGITLQFTKSSGKHDYFIMVDGKNKLIVEKFLKLNKKIFGIPAQDPYPAGDNEIKPAYAF